MAEVTPSRLLDRIAEHRYLLTPAGTRVADIVLEEPALVARLGIVEMAERAGTSVGSVNRFCRALGIPGYTELRLTLAEEVARDQAADPDADPTGDIAADADVGATVALLAASSINAIRRTAALLDTVVLDRLAEAVSVAGQVQVFAFGGSADVAHYLATQLTGIGIPTLTTSDVHNAAAFAVTLTPADVAIAISHSGRARHAVELLDVARDRGATTAAITSSAATPLATAAELTLATTARGSGFRYRGTAGRHAQLFVTDALYVRVAQRRTEETQRLLNLAGAATARYQTGKTSNRSRQG